MTSSSSESRDDERSPSPPPHPPRPNTTGGDVVPIKSSMSLGPAGLDAVPAVLSGSHGQPAGCVSDTSLLLHQQQHPQLIHNAINGSAAAAASDDDTHR